MSSKSFSAHLIACTAVFFLLLCSSALAGSITGSLPDGKVGVRYYAYSSNGIDYDGIYGTETWSVSDGTLPPGLELQSNYGWVTGTPTRAGTYTFTILVSVRNIDYETSDRVSREFTITILPADNPSTVAINGTLPSGTINTPYSSSLTASNGTSPYTWSYSGTLPPGLSFRGSDSASTGTTYTLSGTPTAAGTYSFSVSVTDIYGSTASRDVTVAISGSSPGGLTISGVLPFGDVGTPYSHDIFAMGGNAPYTWSHTGTLPPGLSFESSTTSSYTISGTPTTAGTYSFTVSVSDAYNNTASEDFSITISPIDGGLGLGFMWSFGNGTVNIPYSSSALAHGGTYPYTWSYSGTLPPGLSFATDSTDEGKYILSGIPTTAGTYTFSVTVTDSSGDTATTGDCTVTIGTSNGLTVRYYFIDGTVGESYRDFVTASGDSAPYTWSYTGTLPPGLSFESTTSERYYLSGTPTTAGTYTFSVTVTGNSGLLATKSMTMTISDSSGGLTISYYFIDGTVGKAYSDYIKAEGGTSPYTWSYTGTLPDGTELRYNSSTGEAFLIGTPTTAGTYTFTVQVEDSSGLTATKSMTVTISGSSPYGLTINGSFANGTVGRAYESTVSVSGGTAPYTWTYGGTPPDGTELKYNSSTGQGVLIGTPTAEGTYTFTVQVEDSSGLSATKSMTVTISGVSDSGGGGGGGGCESFPAFFALILTAMLPFIRTRR